MRGETIVVNGRERAMLPGRTVGALLDGLRLARPGVMVAVNGTAVPAGELDVRPLRPGDQVEVIQASAGG